MARNGAIPAKKRIGIALAAALCAVFRACGPRRPDLAAFNPGQTAEADGTGMEAV